MNFIQLNPKIECINEFLNQHRATVESFSFYFFFTPNHHAIILALIHLDSQPLVACTFLDLVGKGATGNTSYSAKYDTKKLRAELGHHKECSPMPSQIKKCGSVSRLFLLHKDLTLFNETHASNTDMSLSRRIQTEV